MASLSGDNVTPSISHIRIHVAFDLANLSESSYVRGTVKMLGGGRPRQAIPSHR